MWWYCPSRPSRQNHLAHVPSNTHWRKKATRRKRAQRAEAYMITPQRLGGTCGLVGQERGSSVLHQPAQLPSANDNSSRQRTSQSAQLARRGLGQQGIMLCVPCSGLRLCKRA